MAINSDDCKATQVFQDDNNVNSSDSKSSSPKARKTTSRPRSWASSKRNSFPGLLEISNPSQPPKVIRLSHRPSLSDTSFPPTLSPSKNRFRGAHTPVSRPDFKFPDFQSPPSSPLTFDRDDASTSIASPDSEKTLYSSENIQLSTYLSSTQPNLQGLFITLANKERQVLEARESLMVAESELNTFKKTWNSTLKKHDSDKIPSEPLLESLMESSYSVRLPRPSYRQVSGSGLGIYQVPYELSETAKQRDQSLVNLSSLQDIDSSEAESSSLDSSETDQDRTSTTLFQEDEQLSNRAPFSTLLERIASIGMFILKELAALLLFGSSEDERPDLSVQPRYPSVIETYYRGSMLNSIASRRL